jgi:hypothetical protein
MLRCVERAYMFHGTLRRIVVLQIIIIIIAMPLNTADTHTSIPTQHTPPSPPNQPSPNHLHLHILPSPIAPLRPPRLPRRSLLQ